ncbi:NAD-glutamate dehydrogenase [Mycolicibacterium fluoranthenivorans]|uniref:NAD-glutamate dehydrogenase n=1 Tax=Mycolicibacterium fluoranthenivorans TaxID=258505 RepID=A0A1G4WWV7_9MYCO|nr:NAD-glutamate dehydrogenase domain-containing protein [Mycolicibacterium fluoranthenivorans]QNJ94770.1 NAD-glutamate dehydrogenase [Mycolicibacterium fluoranthenivorans]SCX31308.1 NAD-glutamate dehydrogenase [Mycolicibacterium fluoranthenivorans]
MTAHTHALGRLLHVQLHPETGGAPSDVRISIQCDRLPSLSLLLPPFTDFGLEVVDERATSPTGGAATSYEIELGLRADDGVSWSESTAGHPDQQERFLDAVRAVWAGHCESDPLNSLVLTAGLTWVQVTWLRAVAAYLRQTQAAFSLPYICEVLAGQSAFGALAAQLFEERFDPTRHDDDDQRAAAQSEVAEQFTRGLDSVANLDEDRILRSVLGVILAIERTNAFQRKADGQLSPTLSFKISPRRIPVVPRPVPAAEIWVYSPSVEAIHMRFGKVARGGIRWSDRREDIRMEVLALSKAQVSKNAVIVPTGAKGAFLPKQLPDPSDREAWLAEGLRTYREFIAALLDVTDNRVGEAIVGPARTVRHDHDDPYLVVAADKGTASFSDNANQIARTYEFWLDDAFASGGSVGYDHKAMGITARGAWVSVERHLREAGIDPAGDSFTVIGIGDMSGDVFGNGMLLAEKAHLVAAFDHRHIFLDPNPATSAALAERRRLASLSRSSWADYDPRVLSEGGMVVDRSAKSVVVSPVVAELLDLEPTNHRLTPTELIRAILSMRADLLWNGGIGTYVKASSESHAQANDRTNDGVRIDADALRVRAIGEGGNLGLTQAARVEAARRGVRLNTDAVDNSAGVDTSDYEVNIKIALAGGREELDTNGHDRAEVLRSMTDDIAETVLRHNHDQNVLLAMETRQSAENLPALRLLMRALTESGHLDPDRDCLPDESELTAREAAGQGMFCPELAVLMASTKNAIKDELQATAIAEDPWFIHTLRRYFPQRLRSALPNSIDTHALGAEIIVNEVVNEVVNQAGITAVNRAAGDTGASVAFVVKAYVAAIEVFDHRNVTQKLDAAAVHLPFDPVAEVRYEGRRLLDRGARWFLDRYPSGFATTEIVDALAQRINSLSADEPERLWGKEKQLFETKVSSLVARGATTELALLGASYLDSYVLLDIIEIADDLELRAEDVADLYHYVSAQFGVDYLLTRVSLLSRRTYWDRLARTALREELYAVLSKLTRAVASRWVSTPSDRDVQGVFDEWQTHTTHLAVRARKTVSTASTDERPQINALTVVVRALRALAHSA